MIDKKINNVIREVPNFPKKGINFKDITSLLLDANLTNDIIDGKQSAVWLEALNRIHAQKSIIEWCLK